MNSDDLQVQPARSGARAGLAGQLVGPDGADRPIEADEMGDIVQTLLRSTIRRQTPERTLIDKLRELENAWIRDLRTPSDADNKDGLRRAVFPLAVAVLT